MFFYIEELICFIEDWAIYFQVREPELWEKENHNDALETIKTIINNLEKEGIDFSLWQERENNDETN